MVRKKRIILVGLVLLVFGGVLFFRPQHEEEFVVDGVLSVADIAQIKRVVRLEMRREIFPSFSWNGLIHLPAASMQYYQNRAIAVYVPEKDAAILLTGRSSTGRFDDAKVSDVFSLTKGSNGWQFKATIGK
jgi:hypothetical protein